MYAGFSKDPWNRIMYPETPPPESRGPSIERWRLDISSNPTVRFMKAVDPDTDTTIAFARWMEWRDPKANGKMSRQEVATSAPILGLPTNSTMPFVKQGEILWVELHIVVGLVRINLPVRHSY